VGKVWILDTETKGTGANMVPLDRVVRKPGSDAVKGFVLPALKPPAADPAGPRTRATIRVLERARSIVDVTIWVWQPETERWRMLSLEEARALWEYRGRLADAIDG
jgi:hypothetical protein